MAKLNVIFKEIVATTCFCGLVSFSAISPAHAQGQEELLCTQCTLPSADVYTFNRKYEPQVLDESLKDQTYEGLAPLDTVFYWSMVVGVSERLTNISERTIDFYVWFLDEVVATSTKYGTADLFALSELGMYGITGITLSRAEATLNWLQVNHPDVYERIMNMMTEEYPGLEGNLVANVPFNLAVTLEAIWLACPAVPENFDDVAVRAEMYSEIIRGGGKTPYYDFLEAYDRRMNVDNVPAGEDWGYIE